MSDRKPVQRHKSEAEVHGDRKLDHIEYVIIKTDGKSVRSSSGILTKNSSMIKKRVKDAEKLRNSPKNGDIPGMDICSEWLYGRNKDELELDFPNLKYKDVKKAIQLLDGISSEDEFSSKLHTVRNSTCDVTIFPASVHSLFL